MLTYEVELLTVTLLKKYPFTRSLYDLLKIKLYNPYRRIRLVERVFPAEIWIENTNLCNSRCIMCPRESHTRKQGFMPMDVFIKLIDEVAQYKTTVKRLHLHNFGEPLLDKALPERIRIAKNAGIRHVYFVTNGSLLTPELSRRIIENGLDEMKISFYGTDPETYNATMNGLDFQRTLENLRSFFSIRQKLNRTNPSVVIQYLPVETNRGETDAFERLMRPLINESTGDRLNVFQLHNFGGGREYIQVGRIVSICSFPWRTMVILQDGRVASCCFDYNGVQVLGDVHESSLYDIWHGEKFQAMRKKFKYLSYNTYPICMKCSVIRSS